MEIVSAKLRIINPQGLHMRPAQMFTAELAKYRCSITVVYRGVPVNGKSITALMAACIGQGSEVEIRCEGEQEVEALRHAVALVKSGLGDRMP